MSQAAAPVKIGDRQYTIDLRGMVRRPLQSIRQMVDQGLEPSEQSFDNQGVWKRTQSDFILGAGQTWFDQEQESVRRRHRISRGADMLGTRRMLTNRKQATAKVTRAGVYNIVTSAPIQGKMVETASNYWVWLWGVGVFKTASKSDFTLTQITGVTMTGRLDMAYYNGKVYIASATNMYSPVYTASTYGSVFAAAMPPVAIAAGRLVSAGAISNRLQEVSIAGTTTTIYEHPNVGFEWTAMCGASNGIYAAGVDDVRRTEIHLITVVDSTGALAPPYPVGELPANERVYEMRAFSNLLVMGTSKGLRLCRIESAGYLTYGPLLEVGHVKSVHVEGRYAYFAYTNVGVDSAMGIGKVDLSKFTEVFVPAYQADLTTTTYNSSGQVLSILTEESGKPLFLAMNSGQTSMAIFGEHATAYETAKYWSGGITYGTPEQKAVVSVEAAWDALPTGASVQVELLDGVNGTSYGGITNSTPGSTGAKASPRLPLETETVEVKITLTPSSTEPVVLRRWTVRSLLMPFKSEEIILPVVLNNRIEDESGGHTTINVKDEWNYLNGLAQDKTRFDFTFGSETVRAYLDAIAVEPGESSGWFSWDQQRQWPQGTVLVRLVTVEDGQ